MRFTFTMDENLDERLEDVSSKTGLNKSEIVRRGLLEQLKELEG